MLFSKPLADRLPQQLQRRYPLSYLLLNCTPLHHPIRRWQVRYRNGQQCIRLTKLLKDWSWKRYLLLRPLPLRLWRFSHLLRRSVVHYFYHLRRLINCRLENHLQSQKSVSLGRSTTVNAGGSDEEATGLSLAGGSGSGGDGGLPRRRSLLGLVKPRSG